MSFDRLEDFRSLQARDHDPHGRGYAFERWLNSCLEEEGLDPRLNVHPKGEQIDGSFVMNARAMLLEAKWRAQPIPASDIYEFKGKVDGKLVGTVGFFISMSGYSEDAVDAVRAGKSVNVLLLNEHDVMAAAQDEFAKVFSYKLRIAADQGEIFTPYTAAISPRATHRPAGSDGLEREGISQLAHGDGVPPLAIVVEGQKDETIVTILANRLLEQAGVDRPFAVFSANGRYGLASTANSMSMEFPAAYKTLIVTDVEPDTDWTPQDWRDTILRSVLPQKTDVIVAVPAVEAWIAPTVSAKRLTIPDIWNLAQTVDLGRALDGHPELRAFRDAILEGAQPI